MERELSFYGGIRRAPTIAKQAGENLHWLNGRGWHEIEKEFAELLLQRSRPPREEDNLRERKSSAFADEKLKGFDPKQSRNLWQWLGLTRYEIPLDSRVTDWFNGRKIFPFTISAQPLADRSYYAFVLDGVQALCKAVGVLPCVLDAAIFSSYDRDWNPEEIDN